MRSSILSAAVLASIISLLGAEPSRGDVFSNVAEASGYSLVYTLPIPASLPMGTNYNTNAVPI